MISDFFDRCGGRRFFLTFGCSVMTTALCWAEKISGGEYVAVILGTVAAYIAGGTMQKHAEIKAHSTAVSLQP